MLENQLPGTVVETVGEIRLLANSFVDSADDLDFDLVKGNTDGNFKVELLKLDQQQQEKQRRQQQHLLLQQQQQQQHHLSNENDEVENNRMHDSKSITNQTDYPKRRASNNIKESIEDNRRNNDNQDENNNNNNQNDNENQNGNVDEEYSGNEIDDEEEEGGKMPPFLFQIVTTHPLDAEQKSMYNLVLRVRHR